MSTHERRAPRRSQLKLKVKGKDSDVQMARTCMLLAPKQQLPPHMARSNRRASVAGAKSATPTACVTSAEMALGLRQTSHSSGAALPPPFVAVGANFFQHPLGEPNKTAKTQKTIEIKGELRTIND